MGDCGGYPPRLIFCEGNCPHCPPPGSAAYDLTPIQKVYRLSDTLDLEFQLTKIIVKLEKSFLKSKN